MKSVNSYSFLLTSSKITLLPRLLEIWRKLVNTVYRLYWLHNLLNKIDNTILRKTVMVNTGIKAISQTDYEDRSSFAKEMGLKTTEIEKLKPLQFYIKNDLGQVPFKIQVPILGKEYYMTDQNTKRLLRFLAFHSRQYIKIPKLPLATPPPPPPKEERKSDLNHSGNKPLSHLNKSNNRKDDPFDNNLKPAF